MLWSNELLRRVATHNLTFQQLCAELEAALQLDKGATLANLPDSAERSGRAPVAETASDILYTGQGRYMNDPSGLSRSFSRSTRPYNREWNRVAESYAPRKANFDPFSVQGCLHCGGNHLLKDCTKPLNTVRAASKKTEYFAKRKRRNCTQFIKYLPIYANTLMALKTSHS